MPWLMLPIEVLIVLTPIPFLALLASGPLSRRAARGLPPDVAAKLLTVMALSVALITGMFLCVLGTVGLAQVPGLAGLGHWSPDSLREKIGIPPLLCLAVAPIAIYLLASAWIHLIRVIVNVRRTRSLVAAMPATRGIVVLEDEQAVAFASPGRQPRVVVSTGMLAGLTAEQRRVLLAHEFAHLRHRHYLYVQLGRLSAAANPLLRPVSRAIDLAVERWADEEAVREVGDRTSVARALAAAALGQSSRQAPAGALAATQTDVVDRVASLLSPPVRRRVFAVVGVALVVACVIGGGLVINHIHELMELSQ